MAYNYGIDAVPRSGPGNNGSAQNLFCGSSADNVPTALVGPATTVTVASGANVPIPASAFSGGSGVYLVEANGNGNNDVQAFGRVIITPAGTFQAAAGFTNAVASGTATYTAGPPIAVTIPYQIIFLNGFVPTIFQNVTASVVYIVTCTKIANLN